MVVGKKLAKESLLPSVLEDDDAETESESAQLGGIGSRPPSRPRKAFSRGSVDRQTVTRSGSGRHSSPEGEVSVRGERKEDEGEEEEEEGSGVGDGDSQERGKECVITASDEDYDTDLELGDVKEAYDPTGQTRYREACRMFNVVPVSYFLKHMGNTELAMMHHGLGPQGTKALAVSLVTNTSLLKLNLRDNCMEGTGGAAMAEMLKENCYITEVDLGENRLGECGAQTLSSMLQENTTLVSLSMSGNELADRAAQHLAQTLTSNTKLETLDLSHNTIGDAAGQVLGHAIAENTGLKSLSLAWNCIRGKGAVALAKGLGMYKLWH
ncbi:leucine-rich repeat-containing protein 74B-like [Oncorhynchus tshawytscha]|uniref:leucine-rich repeat-containing protein 74B-like n=1 Tax=Oncorhynchus tshawytscha TaxID=74940 RepID=UPI000D0A5634|nr:leucine-rich repeat-containing protein 74B-like [Oncorhynchus tshawytscha]